MNLPRCLIALLLLCATMTARATGCDGMSVTRALFTADIANHEPTRPLHSLPSLPAIRFFTEIRGGAGRIITHVWLYRGRPVARIRLPIRGDRWRTWSSKNLGVRRDGDWSVRVLGPGGCLLTQKTLPAKAPTGHAAVNPATLKKQIAQGHLTDAQAAIKQALATSPPPESRKALQRLLKVDMPIARARQELGENRLYMAEARLQGLPTTQLSKAEETQVKQLTNELLAKREQLDGATTLAVVSLQQTLNATMIGGAPCPPANDQLVHLLSTDPDLAPLSVAGQVRQGGDYVFQLLDRRTGTTHLLRLSCPLRPSLLPGRPGKGD